MAEFKIRGTTYPSARAAARAIGVSHTTVLEAIKRQTEDHVGLGVGGRSERSGHKVTVINAADLVRPPVARVVEKKDSVMDHLGPTTKRALAVYSRDRGISLPELAARILTTVVLDDLLNAVLDD